MTETISLDDFSMQPQVYCGWVVQGKGLRPSDDWTKLVVEDEENEDSKPIILVTTFEEASQAIGSNISRDIDLSKYGQNPAVLKERTEQALRSVRAHEVITFVAGNHTVYGYRSPN